jgi:hypothetical protein
VERIKSIDTCIFRPRDAHLAGWLRKYLLLNRVFAVWVHSIRMLWCTQPRQMPLHKRSISWNVHADMRFFRQDKTGDFSWHLFMKNSFLGARKFVFSMPAPAKCKMRNSLIRFSVNLIILNLTHYCLRLGQTSRICFSLEQQNVDNKQVLHFFFIIQRFK